MYKILPALFFSFLLLGITPLHGMQQNIDDKIKNGIICFFNKEKNDALAWFEQAYNKAKNKDMQIEALFWIGVINYGINGEPPNFLTARKCFEIVAQDESNRKRQSRALLFLGQMHLFRRGVPEDFKKASYFFGQALQISSTRDIWLHGAINEMKGLIYYFDPIYNSDLNKIQQTQFFLEAAANQNVNKSAQTESLCLLGYICYRGAKNKLGLLHMGPKQCGQKACEYFQQVLKNPQASAAATERADFFLKDLEEFKNSLQ